MTGKRRGVVTVAAAAASAVAALVLVTSSQRCNDKTVAVVVAVAVAVAVTVVDATRVARTPAPATALPALFVLLHFTLLALNSCCCSCCCCRQSVFAPGRGVSARCQACENCILRCATCHTLPGQAPSILLLFCLPSRWQLK